MTISGPQGPLGDRTATLSAPLAPLSFISTDPFATAYSNAADLTDRMAASAQQLAQQRRGLTPAQVRAQTVLTSPNAVNPATGTASNQARTQIAAVPGATPASRRTMARADGDPPPQPIGDGNGGPLLLPTDPASSSPVTALTSIMAGSVAGLPAAAAPSLSAPGPLSPITVASMRNPDPRIAPPGTVPVAGQGGPLATAAALGLAAPKTQDDYDALPRGARYVYPGDGSIRVKS